MAQPNSNTKTTIFVGHVETWMDEAYLLSVFGTTGAVSNVKIVRDHKEGVPKGYAFVEYAFQTDAEALITRCNGDDFAAEDGQRFRLNWATHGVNAPRNANDISIYVGNLVHTVRDNDLFKVFANKYSSLLTAKVILDTDTKVSKGYGFIVLRDQQEAHDLIAETQNVYLHGKAVTIKPAMRQTLKEAEMAQRAISPPMPPMQPGLLPLPGPPAGPPPASLPQHAAWAAQGWVPQPTISNSTTANAQMQAWQLLGGTQELQAPTWTQDGYASPGLEHFQTLLHHPFFVQAFEKECASARASEKEAAGIPGIAKLSPLLHDRPDTFARRPSVSEMNEEFLESMSLDICMEGSMIW